MLFLQQWICTHPVPLHAHTHFLSGLRAALVLNAGQAVPAPPPLPLRVFQELHHARLVDGIDALRCTKKQQTWPSRGDKYLLEDVEEGGECLFYGGIKGISCFLPPFMHSKHISRGKQTFERTEMMLGCGQVGALGGANRDKPLTVLLWIHRNGRKGGEK